MRLSFAMIFADSIRQTASMVRWMDGSIMAVLAAQIK
jgi:hypothetical protein